MNVTDWVEKSRNTILKGEESFQDFNSPDKEITELYLELTYACNMRCRMCNVWAINRNDHMMPRKEMPVEELVDYIDESKILKGINGLVISGGEPFLKKDFQELCLYFLKNYKNMSVGILSNLYNHSIITSKLKGLGSYIDRVWIGTSLDGLGHLHNNTRGIDDAFEKFQESLKVIRKTLPYLSIVVNYTLTTDNYTGIYDTHRFCRDNALDLSIQFPVPWKGAEIFTFGNEQIDEIEHLMTGIIEDAVSDHESGKTDEKGLMSKLFYLTGLIDYQRNPRRVFKRCVAGRRFTTISPEGKIYFCPILKNMAVGDLREDPFDEIWMGKKANDLRKKIDKGFCDCWLNCTIYPNSSDALSCVKKKTTKKNILQRVFG